MVAGLGAKREALFSIVRMFGQIGLNVCQCYGVSLDALGVTTSLASSQVVLQIIDLNIDCCLVARLADLLDILHIWHLLVVRKQSQSRYYLIRESLLDKVVKSVFRILYNIVEESHDTLSVGVAHHSNRYWVEDSGVAIEVVVGSVSLRCELNSLVYVRARVIILILCCTR